MGDVSSFGPNAFLNPRHLHKHWHCCPHAFSFLVGFPHILLRLKSFISPFPLTLLRVLPPTPRHPILQVTHHLTLCPFQYFSSSCQESWLYPTPPYSKSLMTLDLIN